VSGYRTYSVPVSGGELAVGAWGPTGSPVVLAAHGITANHLSWAGVAAALGDACTLVAPDLRGRGESGTLPGPYGMAAHADDLIRVLDHLDAERATFVGHSMGGAVVATSAARHPDRVTNVVLVDGGPALSVPEGLDVDATLEAVIGPAVARLSMEFESLEAYRDFWRAHPSVGGDRFTTTLQNYVDYDLCGEPPHLRSKVSGDAVRADGADILANPDVPAAVAFLPGPTPWLRAERGLLDQPEGLYPDAVAAQLCAQYPKLVDVFVPDVNHYTITLSDAGAKVVADHIRAAIA
jgi:pimeloyl-ACP methyl ester carboxylesterase